MNKSKEPFVLMETSSGFIPINLQTEALVKRRICLFGPIDDELASSVCLQLRHLDEEDPNAEIEILINSPGGLAPAGLMICDELQCCRARTRSIVIGEASSIAGVIAICADERLIHPNGSLMLHEPSNLTAVQGCVSSSASEVERRGEILANLKAKLIKIYVEHSNIDEKKVADLMSGFGACLSAEEAVDMGFVDKVVPYIEKEQMQ